MNSNYQEKKISKLPSFLFAFLNMLIFGLGLVLLIFGILYLTVYRYEYSLTHFSIDLIAGIFIAIGIVLVLVATARLFCLRPESQIVMTLISALILIFFFLILFILGVVGLSLHGNGALNEEARNDFFQTAKQYDERAEHTYPTRKINWLQKKFLCCGIDSYEDWRLNIKLVSHFNSNNNLLLLREEVPDSCCLTYNTDCGKNTFNREKSNFMHTRGCLDLFLRQFFADLVFLSALAVAIALLLLLSGLAMFYVYSKMKNYEQYENTATCEEITERRHEEKLVYVHYE